MSVDAIRDFFKMEAADLSLLSLYLAMGGLAVLAFLNVFGVTRIAPYVVIGLIIWVCVLKSGVHATLAGVAIALTIPLRAKDSNGHSPLLHLEHELHRWVAFGVLPIFAFANAGINFEGFGLASLFEPVTLGVALGLFIGGLVWQHADFDATVRLGVISGSILSAAVGFTALSIGAVAKPKQQLAPPHVLADS